MSSGAKCLIALITLIAAWGSHAHAEEPKEPPTQPPAGAAPPAETPAAPPTETPPTEAAPTETPPTETPAPPPEANAAAQGLSDEELAKLAEGETIEIYDERPDKPFDRDTDVRLT